MRLSEAIRLGAMLRPQAFGTNARDGGTCAIGSALEAVGAAMDELECNVFPLFRIGRQFSCPAQPPCSWPKAKSLYLAIIHLNDSHEWTREQIADWVQSIEEAHESPASRFVAVDPVAADPGTLTTRV